MAFEEFLILRCLAERGLEGLVALIQPLGNLITASKAGVRGKRRDFDPGFPLARE
jgi:hypothetical protein